MIKYSLLFILMNFLTIQSLDGQEKKIYEPFNFENYIPIWKHTVIDTSLAGKFKEVNYSTGDSIFYDGFSHFYGTDIFQVDPVFYNNTIIVIEQFGSAIESQGAFIQCLNSKTGELIWESGYDLRNISQREYPSYAYINTSGQLEILGYREDSTVEPNPFGYWNHAKLTVRKYDPNTGELVERLIINEEDSLTADLWPTSPLLSLGVKSEIYPYSDNEYQYIILSDTLKSFVLDSNSHIIDNVIYRNLIHKYNVTVQTKMYRTSKKENIVLMYYLAQGSYNFADSSEFYIMKIDNDNNLLSEKDIRQDLKLTDNYTWLYNIFENDDYITFVGEKHVDIGDTTVPLMIYTVFDSNGRKIEEITLMDENGDPYLYGNYNARIGQVMKLKYEPGILIFVSELGADGYNYLNIFKTDGNGDYTKLKHIKITGKNHSLGLTGGYFTPEGDVVLKVLDFNTDFTDYTNSSIYATVYMAFSAEDLNIKTDTDDEALIYRNLKLYPNPVKQILSIEFPDSFTGTLEIVDELGRKLKTQKVQNKVTQIIDVSNIKSGRYFINIMKDSGKTKYKTQSFVVE